jgi:hypothetical protein
MRKMLFAAMAAVVIGGCDNGVTGVKTINGSWTLRTVNSGSLPFTVSGSGANKTEITDDVITLFEGFTYREVIQKRITTNGTATTTTVTETGSFSTFGTSVTFFSNLPRERRGLIEGNTMTIVENGMVQAYKK